MLVVDGDEPRRHLPNQLLDLKLAVVNSEPAVDGYTEAVRVRTEELADGLAEQLNPDVTRKNLGMCPLIARPACTRGATPKRRYTWSRAGCEVSRRFMLATVWRVSNTTSSTALPKCRAR